MHLCTNGVQEHGSLCVYHGTFKGNCSYFYKGDDIAVVNAVGVIGPREKIFARWLLFIKYFGSKPHRKVTEIAGSHKS